MAKTFYYDSGGLLEATVNDGTYSGTSWSDSNSMTNEERLVDQSIASAASDFNNADALKITFPVSTALDFIALYFSAAETDNISLYKLVATNTFNSAIDITANFSAGWSVKEFSSASATDWHLASTSGDVANLTEFIVGSKLQFEVSPDIGISEVETFGTTLNTSIGGIEYAVKRHEPKTNISFNFANVSETFKNSLQSMESAVQNHKKFIYSEDGTSGAFHYVRLASPIEFTEVSFNRYSASISLIEQLS